MVVKSDSNFWMKTTRLENNFFFCRNIHIPVWPPNNKKYGFVGQMLWLYRNLDQVNVLIKIFPCFHCCIWSIFASLRNKCFVLLKVNLVFRFVCPIFMLSGTQVNIFIIIIVILQCYKYRLHQFDIGLLDPPFWFYTGNGTQTQ